MATLDERVAAELKDVLGALEREQTHERALAEGRADTGDALIHLEGACARHGVDRADWICALRTEAGRLDLEELTLSKVRDRTRMAHFRKRHPPEIAKAYLGLGVSGQRLIAALPANRLEEFVYQGVPTSRGQCRLREAKNWQLRLAVKASRGLPPGEPIPTAKLIRQEPVNRSPFQKFDDAMGVIRGLGSLTLEQTEQLLMMLVSLFAVASRETSRTTRRLSEGAIQVSSPQAGTEAIDQPLRLLNASWKRVEFGPGVDPFEATAQACASVSRLLFTLSRWTRRSGPGRETGS